MCLGDPRDQVGTDLTPEGSSDRLRTVGAR